MEALSSYESLLYNNGIEEGRDKGRVRGRDRGKDRNMKNIGSISVDCDVRTKGKRIEKDSTDFDFLEEKIPDTALRVYGSSGSKVHNSGNVWNKVKIYGASSFDSHRRKEEEERQADIFRVAREGPSVSC